MVILVFISIEEHDAGDHCEVLDSLLTFLKGPKQQRVLYVERSHSCMLGSSLCGMSAKNMVKVLPSQNIFMLTCCFDEECPHPVCQKRMPSEMPR